MSDICHIKNEFISKIKKGNGNHQFNILIVDDDKTIANIFAEILKQRGHNVTIASESISCINKCQNNHYDIIFMDFHLDNLDGVDITDLIKNMNPVKSIIFAFTGDDSNKSIKKFREIGMDGALIKPLNFELINKLMNSLESRNDIDKRVVKLMREIKIKRQLIIFS